MDRLRSPVKWKVYGYLSIANSGLTSLVILNGHGGNYVLGNVVQEGNAEGKRMALFPSRADWAEARQSAQLVSSAHEDMHAGEIETSILLHAHPELSGIPKVLLVTGRHP